MVQVGIRTLDGMVIYIQAYAVPVICGPLQISLLRLLRIHSLICTLMLHLDQTPTSEHAYRSGLLLDSGQGGYD